MRWKSRKGSCFQAVNTQQIVNVQPVNLAVASVKLADNVQLIGPKQTNNATASERKRRKSGATVRAWLLPVLSCEPPSKQNETQAPHRKAASRNS